MVSLISIYSLCSAASGLHLPTRNPNKSHYLLKYDTHNTFVIVYIHY